MDVDVEIGFNGDEVWLKGICQYLPDAWIKGWRDGDKLVFPSEQYLGSASGVPVYFKDVKLENGNTVVKDMELIFDGTDTYTTTDYIFIVTTGAPLGLSISGTGLLIVVTVALENMRQINSRALMVTYDDYQ